MPRPNRTTATNQLETANAEALADAAEGTGQSTVKQANLSPRKLARFIQVPKQLAGVYLSARFDDEGKSDAPVDPQVIEQLQVDFPGIPIDYLDGEKEQ
jgi:hypothetical protein